MRPPQHYKKWIGAVLLTCSVGVLAGPVPAVLRTAAIRESPACLDSDADAANGGIHRRGYVTGGSGRVFDHCSRGKLVEHTCIEDPTDRGRLIHVATSIACPGGMQCTEGVCPGAPVSCRNVPGRDPFEDRRTTRTEAFTTLTSRRWVARRGLENMVLRANGTFSWSRLPGGFCGTPDFVHQGQWNFEIDNEGYGVIYVRPHPTRVARDPATHSWMTVAFRLAENNIFLGSSTFVAHEPIDPWGDQCTDANLPQLQPGSAYDRLVEATWIKTNRSDASYMPHEIRFLANGRFLASYRHGACTHSGFWSLNNWGHAGRTPGELRLTTVADDNSCDLRGNRSASVAGNDSSLALDGDTLMIDQSTYSARTKPGAGE